MVEARRENATPTLKIRPIDPHSGSSSYSTDFARSPQRSPVSVQLGLRGRPPCDRGLSCMPARLEMPLAKSWAERDPRLQAALPISSHRKKKLGPQSIVKVQYREIRDRDVQRYNDDMTTARKRCISDGTPGAAAIIQQPGRIVPRREPTRHPRNRLRTGAAPGASGRAKRG